VTEGLLLDGTVKGWPACALHTSEVATAGLHVADLPTPTLLLREEALAHNIAAMAAWCEQRQVRLAPHAKTAMAPAILRRQLAAGAWGLTVADVRQARVAVACGATQLIIANELARAEDVAWTARETGARVTFCVDSEEGVAIAEAGQRLAGGPPLAVLLELGHPGGRCGVRSDRDAIALAERIAASPHLTLRGVEVYEGLVAATADQSAAAGVAAFLERVGALARELAARGLVTAEDPLLTAGGSAYFDLVADVLAPVAAALGWSLVLRSGCYATHDHGFYARQTPQARGADAVPSFQAAIEVRSTVLSRPEPGRLILDAGRRDVSYDIDLPVVLSAPGLRVVALNDEHAYVDVEAPGSAIGVGEVVRLGISHPCTALERWRVVALVAADDRILEAIPTWF
jgi:D-serine deaminase-like pyridoxal phosphate-dependent protein